jgi:protein tyrosine phosphatase (PTP) superfamily phosphohydrolase (DUF442 family)
MEMERQELLQQMRSKLQNAGIAFEDINVFGAIRCNVHVKCVSRATAQKWAEFLAQVFSGSRVTVTPTIWNAKRNCGTVMCPTMREGFLIAVAGNAA